MRNLVGQLVAVAAWLALTSLLQAQSPARPGQAATQAIPNLTGVWDNTHLNTRITGPGALPPGTGAALPGGIPGPALTLEEPAMLPWAAEKYRAARTGAERWAKGIDAVDPTLSCFPYGPTRVYTLPRPWELRQTAQTVLLLFERDHGVRRVHLDGRGHPDGYPITWMGHSIGRYDGDTLVVDTVGIHDQTWIDHMGHPHTEALRIQERFRLLDQDTIQIDFTFDDPETYARPWLGKKIFKRAPPGFDLLEDVICEDWLEMGKNRRP